MSEIFLPIIGAGALPSQLLFSLIQAHPQQQHPLLIWDECLATAALLRCGQMAIEWAHCYKGDCVNRIVRRTCALPFSYSENGNNIESAVGGVRQPGVALEHLLTSTFHADHILGRNPFFRGQSRVGIGFKQVIGSAYQYYYVVLISG